MSGGRTVSEILADGGEPLLDRLHALTLPDPDDVADGSEGTSRPASAPRS
jgi:hypothetical protein